MSFQKAYDFFKFPPKWLRILVDVIGQIVFTLLKDAGQVYIGQIEAEIKKMETEYPNLSGDEKFNKVWDFAHELLPLWKTSALDTLIQNLYMSLRKHNFSL